MTTDTQPSFVNVLARDVPNEWAMCKTPGLLRIISLGDVHLGHSNTPTRLIIRNLDTYCTNEQVLADVDMLIITGDLFERLLHNAEDAVHLINSWITRLLYKCVACDVVLRIVEGTPSHDREQSRFFPEQAKNANIPVDLHYATTLSIEYVERFGIHILYVPDKWRTRTEDTLEEVRLEMKRLGLEQVDFAIMHGAFEFQLPAMVKEPLHDSEIYLKLVRFFIFIGHIHFPTRKDRILPAGSYDRLNHGEEHKKGFYDVKVRGPEDHEVVFVENKGAKRYDTVKCHGLDTKELNVSLRKKVESLPKGSAVCIRCSPHDAATGDIEHIKQQWPWIEWSLTVDKEKKKETGPSMTELFKSDLRQFTDINENSIMELIDEDLKRKTTDPAVESRCKERLKELL